MKKELKKLIEHRCNTETKMEEEELIAFLREAQELSGGHLKNSAKDKICKELDIKHSYLKSVLKQISGSKKEKECHKLKICDGKKCQSSDNACLQKHIEKTYDVKKGDVSKKGGFSYKLCGCLKKCKDGPCVKWDGEVYTEMTPKKLDKLIEQK